MRYKHDALGRRIEEGQRQVYFSAGWQAIDERDGSGNKTQYVWSPVYIDAMVLRDMIRGRT